MESGESRSSICPGNEGCGHSLRFALRSHMRDKGCFRCVCTNVRSCGLTSKHPLKKLGLRGHGIQEVRTVLPQKPKVSAVNNHFLF